MIKSFDVQIYDNCDGIPCQDSECQHNTSVVVVFMDSKEFSEIVKKYVITIEDIIQLVLLAGDWSDYINSTSNVKNLINSIVNS